MSEYWQITQNSLYIYIIMYILMNGIQFDIVDQMFSWITHFLTAAYSTELDYKNTK